MIDKMMLFVVLVVYVVGSRLLLYSTGQECEMRRRFISVRAMTFYSQTTTASKPHPENVHVMVACGVHLLCAGCVPVG